jgi:hypothetical protein
VPTLFIASQNHHAARLATTRWTRSKMQLKTRTVGWRLYKSAGRRQPVPVYGGGKLTANTRFGLHLKAQMDEQAKSEYKFENGE